MSVPLLLLPATTKNAAICWRNTAGCSLPPALVPNETAKKIRYDDFLRVQLEKQTGKSLSRERRTWRMLQQEGGREADRRRHFRDIKLLIKLLYPDVRRS